MLFILAIAGTCWFGSTDESDKSFVPSSPVAVEVAEVIVAATPLHVGSHEQPSPSTTAVPQKYAALLDQLPPMTASQLQALLQPDTSDLAQLTAREREISLLLSADEYSLYEQLRESADIQTHLQTFADQIQSTHPLHPQQQRALLLAKLNHSAAAQMLTLDPQSAHPDMPAMEHTYARDVAVQGIDHHQRAFLEEVRPALTHEQWLALAEFERAALLKWLAPAPADRSAVFTLAPILGLDNPKGR